MFEGDVALPRGFTGAETIHVVTRIDGKFVRAISWIVVCVGIESGMSALGRRAVLINDNDERHMTMPIRTEPPLN